MAYQTRQRDPFLDRETHAILVRRGQELLGLVLLGLGVALAALMLSYTPDDPNWMAATDTAPQNLLGRTGASVAAILMMIVGYGALVLPVASIVWGTRLVLHAGTHRALPRVFFLPIVLALASIYSASHVPPSVWTHSFGLGGLFGDTVLGAVLNALPLSAEAGLKLIAAAAFLGGAAMLMHVATRRWKENARMLETVLDDYGVKGEIVSVRPGPVVTMYELEPAPGLKASRVIGLADDIARSMSALSARVSTVPGRSVIGIELPNATARRWCCARSWRPAISATARMRLPLALGKDIGGDPVVANLAKMPHLLIAGTTGSGKSVAINTMILSLLYRLTPEECRLIMIDPKMLELSVYDGIPHLLSPVVTDPKKAVVALKWVVARWKSAIARCRRWACATSRATTAG
jgi:DNA segregation ATPase FtsK/SpoIIIE-like protein